MKSLRQAILFVLTLALMALPFLVFFKSQAITDWLQLRNYAAPAGVASLATQDTMTSYSRHVFYVNHPDIESNVNQFRSDCNVTEQTIVLGCYHSNQAGIFVYNVTDARLAGVEQVTAAHEMLHAAYDRLSTNDRNYVDGLLQDYYNHDLHDQRIIDTMNSYRQIEPNDVVSEMHSVFGTEIADLPAPLEAYYSRYFTNRHVITDFANAYENEFTGRQDQIKSDDAKLTQMKNNINQEEQGLNSQLAQINQDRARLDSLRSSGNLDAYNAGVSSFNNEVNTYNRGIGQLRSDIAAYNQLVNERNAIAEELASLSQAIDTRLTPQTTQ